MTPIKLPAHMRLFSGHEYKVADLLMHFGPATNRQLVHGIHGKHSGTGMTLQSVDAALAILVGFRVVLMDSGIYRLNPESEAVDWDGLKRRYLEGAKQAQADAKKKAPASAQATAAAAAPAAAIADDPARRAVIAALERHFVAQSRCIAPRRDGSDTEQQRAIARDWDTVLYEDIYVHLCGSGEDAARDLITRGIAVNRERNLMIATPRSILSSCAHLVGLDGEREAAQSPAWDIQ